MRPFRKAVLLLGSGALFSTGLWSQTPQIPAVELVRRTVRNETNPRQEPANFMFRTDKKNAQGSQTRLMVDTKEAMVGVTVARDGKPLGQEEQAAEFARVQRFVDDPDELRKKHSREKEDAERTARIVRALPDAFEYEYGEATLGSMGVGKTGDPLVRVNFHPKPGYEPPSRVEQVLTGMEGYLLIDTKANRIAKIDGTLIKQVGFGWGILGHLDRGGHFMVEQGDVGRDQWTLTRMQLGFTGKLLIFKSLNIQSEERFTDFRAVSPDITFAQGVDLVRKELQQKGRLGAIKSRGSGLTALAALP